MALCKIPCIHKKQRFSGDYTSSYVSLLNYCFLCMESGTTQTCVFYPLPDFLRICIEVDCLFCQCWLLKLSILIVHVDFRRWLLVLIVDVVDVDCWCWCWWCWLWMLIYFYRPKLIQTVYKKIKKKDRSIFVERFCPIGELLNRLNIFKQPKIKIKLSLKWSITNGQNICVIESYSRKQTLKSRKQIDCIKALKRYAELTVIVITVMNLNGEIWIKPYMEMLIVDIIDVDCRCCWYWLLMFPNTSCKRMRNTRRRCAKLHEQKTTV